MTLVIAYVLPNHLQLPRVDLRGWLALGRDSRALVPSSKPSLANPG
jgi:hypothetical protein